MTTNTKITSNDVEIIDPKSITINRSISEQNTTSTFSLSMDSPYGRHTDDFNIDDTIDIFADIDSPPTTKIFRGIIENKTFRGRGTKTTLVLEGRDYGAVLQDVLVFPRIFKDTEVSEIVNSLMSQNISESLITTNNVNVTTTTIDKITFSNVSVFDAIRQLADIAGFFFYVDQDKDLHFEQKNSTSSGVTLDNTNVQAATFRTSDDDVFNKVTVQGDRQLTGAQQIFTTGTDNTGSVYILDDKPFNPVVTISGTTNTVLQPGGVINIDDPQTKNAKYLVDFQGRQIVTTSGTAAGDNIQPDDTVVIVDYQRSTPLVAIRQSASPFPKHKIITDRNIRDINEASLRAQTFLNENSDPKVNGNIDVKNIIDLIPGNTVVVNLPDQEQNSETYAITNVKYEFNPTNNQSDRILSLRVNRKISNFLDIVKEQILRLRVLEASETDSSITQVQLGSSVVGVYNETQVVSRSIGSAFYFHVPGHDQLNSPSALLGDMRAGSTVFVNGSEI